MNSKYNELNSIYYSITDKKVKIVQSAILLLILLCFCGVIFYYITAATDDISHKIPDRVTICLQILCFVMTLTMVSWILRWCIFLYKASQGYGLGAAFGYFSKKNPWLKYLTASFVGALAGLVLADFLLHNNSVVSTVSAAAAPIMRASNINININITINFTFAISFAAIGAALLKIWRKIKGTTTEQSNA